MSGTKNYGLTGIGQEVELGQDGSKIKGNPDYLEVLDSAGDRIRIKAQDPVEGNDVVTLNHLNTYGVPKVSGQINADSPPPVIEGAIFVVTTGNEDTIAGALFQGIGTYWVEIYPLPEGLRIVPIQDLTGGTIEFIGDIIYVWDLQGLQWVSSGQQVSGAEILHTGATAPSNTNLLWRNTSDAGHRWRSSG